jgi:hypothetical protein
MCRVRDIRYRIRTVARHRRETDGAVGTGRCHRENGSFPTAIGSSKNICFTWVRHALFTSPCFFVFYFFFNLSAELAWARPWRWRLDRLRGLA